jgi:membrane-associated phospholipid phosphatase
VLPTPTPVAANKTRGKLLPRGFGDLVFQISLWVGFLLAYRFARGIIDHGGSVTPVARENARRVIAFESNVHALFEQSLQSLLLSSRYLVDLAAATYWLSQFVVLGIALLWVYFRQTESFTRFRNWLMLANVIGLVGFVFVPTAPPRMFPNLGFLDVEALFSGITPSSKGVSSLANPYAAMPSLHAADAFIVGISMAYVCRRLWAKVLWLIWPLWVWFTVMATGNHFWLDCLVGVLVAVIAAPVADPRFRFWRRKSLPTGESTAAPE